MMSLLNPAFWLGVLLAAMALFGSGYAAGSKHASSACSASQAKAQQAAHAKADEINTHREQVAQSREVAREQIRVVYRTLKEKADETPVSTDCGLDADGLRIWNAANAGTTTPVLGEPDYRLPSAATSSIWPVERFAAKPFGGDGAVQPVPRPDEQAEGVREGGTVGAGNPSASPLRGLH